jgi:HK97 family phage prohead protease
MSKPKQKTKSTRELRVQAAPQKFEVRGIADGSRSISGYGAVLNSLSDDLGGFREQIRPGAFRDSLANTNIDPLCLYGHNNNQILGRRSSGTLQIAESNIGLKFTCILPDTSTARDLIALMEHGDLSQMSFRLLWGKVETSGQRSTDR